MAWNKNGEQINTIKNNFRDDFAGALQNPFVSNTDWTVTTGSGMTIQRNGSSELTVTTGTTINAETKIKSTRTFRMPLKASVAWKRNGTAGSGMYIELINANGDMIASLQSLSNDLFTRYTKNTNAGIATPSTVNFSGGNSQGYNLDTIEMQPDKVIYSSSDTDGSTSLMKGSSIHNTKVPDFNEEYYLQIRIVNANSSNSNLTYTIDAVSVIDMTYVNANIGGGSGSSTILNSVPSFITGSSTSLNVTVTGTTSSLGVLPYLNSNSSFSATSLAGAGTYTGTGYGTVNSSTKFKAWAIADKDGTLYIDVLPNGSSTWILGVKSATIPVGGGTAAIDLDVPPAYIGSGGYQCRGRYVNGSTAQGYFTFYSNFLGQ
jgi:hypothetical protein